MPDEKPVEQYLSDFTGSESEQRKAKSEFIKKHGYAAYEQLVLRSRKSFYARKHVNRDSPVMASKGTGGR